jgi:flagellar FliL protein
MASAAGDKSGGAKGNAASGAGSGKKKILLLAAPLLLAAGGAGAWFSGLLPFGGRPGAEHAVAAEGEGTHVGQAGGVRPLEPFLANLADESGSRYLKTTIQVEFVTPEPPPTFDARMPQMRDAILTLLTSKTFADIRTPAGKETLRDDVIDRLNHVLQTASVKAVYFTEFIVQ